MATGGAAPPLETLPWTHPHLLDVDELSPAEIVRLLDTAAAMVDAGADIVDIGGESTRPGANPVSDAEEIDLTVPIIERARQLGQTLTVDVRAQRLTDRKCFVD